MILATDCSLRSADLCLYEGREEIALHGLGDPALEVAASDATSFDLALEFLDHDERSIESADVGP